MWEHAIAVGSLLVSAVAEPHRLGRQQVTCVRGVRRAAWTTKGKGKFHGSRKHVLSAGPRSVSATAAAGLGQSYSKDVLSKQLIKLQLEARA